MLPEPTPVDERMGAPAVTSAALIAAHGEAARRLTAAKTLAKTLAYDGDLTVPVLLDGIRHYQRRTVEDCLALGVRLVLLREITPRGQFDAQIEPLGISRATAYRFMGAARKTAQSSQLRRLAGQQRSVGKMLELLVLDDDDAEQLLDGGQVGALTLDDVDAMAPSELRRALREARDQNDAKDRVLADKSAALDRAATQAEAAQAKARTEVPHADRDARRVEIEREVMARTADILVGQLPDLRCALDALREHTGDDIPCVDLMRARIGSLLAAVRDLADDYGAENRTADGSTGSVAGDWDAFTQWDQRRAAAPGTTTLDGEVTAHE